MNSSVRTSISEVLDRVFSSMSFGGLFGMWSLVTAIIAYRRGLLAAAVAIGFYCVAWLGVAVLSWLVSRRGT